MKQITIIVPDNCELKQDGNTYTVVEKEKKLTYEDIARELFENKTCFYIDTTGEIVIARELDSDIVEQFNNCKSKKQAQKLLAINKLMNVAKYLNGDWRPDWKDTNGKFFIVPNHEASRFDIEEDVIYQNSYIYFKSEELAEQAIEILGEDTIKLAFCTDY